MDPNDFQDLKEAFHYLDELVDRCQDAGYDLGPDRPDLGKLSDERLSEAIGYAGGVQSRLIEIEDRRAKRSETADKAASLNPYNGPKTGAQDFGDHLGRPKIPGNHVLD